MTKFSVLCTAAVLSAAICSAQRSESHSIQEVIEAFAKAGDSQDLWTLDDLLDDHYRIVMNRLFGSTDVGIITKPIYLEKIKTKEFGGDNRKTDIQEVTINGNTASVKVRFDGEKMNMVSLIGLVKTADGKWKLISDTPMVL